ncbi:hypothetical protein ACI2KR_30160 [Pseudomonas luteola]
MKKVSALIVAVLVSANLSGCVSSQSADVYARNDVMRAQSVAMGTITGLRPVTIEGSKSFVGAAAGALIGGMAGSTLGGGRGAYIGAIAGAGGGGLLGAYGEERLTRSNGVEITVREDSGYQRAYVQEVDSQRFRLGDRVKIIVASGKVRVVR